MEKDTYILNSYATYSYGDYLYYEIEFLDYVESTKTIAFFHNGEYFEQKYPCNAESRIQLKLCKRGNNGKIIPLLYHVPTDKQYHFNDLINFEIEGFNIKFIYKKKKLKLG